MNRFMSKQGLGLVAGFMLSVIGCQPAQENESEVPQKNEVAQLRQKGGGGGCFGSVRLLCKENPDTTCWVSSYWEPTDQTIYTCDTSGLTLADRCTFDISIDPGKVTVQGDVPNPKISIVHEPDPMSPPPATKVIFEVVP